MYHLNSWKKYVYSGTEFEFRWDVFHLETLEIYFGNLLELLSGSMLNLDEWMTLNPQIVASFTQELKQMFMVSSLRNEFQENHKSPLIEAFLCFLLRLLYKKPNSISSRILDTLEMELRCLLDMSLVDHEAQFEAVANEAGCLVHYLLFSPDPLLPQIRDERIAAVLNHIQLFKSTLQSSHLTFHTTPTTSLVNAFPIVNSVVDDLEHLLKGKDSKIADVKDQINLLHKGLLLLQSLMISDVRSPQPSEIGELNLPLMRIGGIANRAESLITTYLVRDAPLWYVITTLSYLNREIEATTMELQVITQRCKFGGLKVTESFIAQLPLEDERKKSIIVGVEEKETEILDQLVGGGTKSLQVISILGMAGLGKTTLAKKLYNHSLVRDWFDKLSWSVISRTYERHSILAHILIQINSEFNKDKILNMEDETLIEHIYKTLKGRRYLVVMDDVWDSNIWDELQRCFPKDSNGSRILLTSRNKDVIPPNSMNHELPLLLDEQCWELLEKKVFGSRTCPPQLLQIGKKIAAKCHGLPLTVVVIAGILSTMDEEEGTWEEVKESLASYIDGEEFSVLEVLELSYKHLADHLKPCFLHFGVYAEDEEISVGKLKRLWMAEGFIRRDKEKSKESVAEEYLMELIDRNLVMVGKRRSDGKGVKTCVVHDLLRDLCLKKCEEESFLQYLNNDCHNIFGRGHRLRAIKSSCRALSLSRHVRSIYGDTLDISEYVRDMISLRVLHFRSIWDANFFGVEYLANLRYLVINIVPSGVGMLKNLEYIKVYGTSRTPGCIPPAIAYMEKLRFFGAVEAVYDRRCNLRSNNLEYLSGLAIKTLLDEHLLRCSPNILKLKCSYMDKTSWDEVLFERRYHDSVHIFGSLSSDYGLKKCTTTNRTTGDKTIAGRMISKINVNPFKNVEDLAPRFDLSFLTQLGSLSISFRHRYISEFGFPPNIRKLSLSTSGFAWEKISIVGRLENLEVLKLMLNAFRGERWDTRDGEFQKLRFLLIDTVDLVEWNVASSEHFPQLRQLILIGCYNLREIPREIGEITTLESIEVKGRCRGSMLESAERIKREEWEMGNEGLRVFHDVLEKEVK